MKKLLLIVLTCLLIGGCTQYRSVKDCPTYVEAADPSPDNTADWGALEPGLKASVGSVDHLYAKSSVPDVVTNNSWKGSAWKGERVSAQLVFWSKEAISQVECEFSGFKSSNGENLPASIAQARFVRYVITDEFGSGCGKSKPDNFAASLSSDASTPWIVSIWNRKPRDLYG